MNQNFPFRPYCIQYSWCRHGLLLLLCSFFLLSNASAQCPPGSVSLNTQAQINAFLANYPNCTQINGNLSIASSPINSITSLAPLSNIATVTGTLNVTNTAALNNLSGLSGLTTIGVNFYIDGNSGLQSVSGMNSLQSIGGFLYVINNPSIQTFNGFNNLVSLGTGFWFNNNDALTQFQAFDDLTTVSGPIVIVENTNLTSVIDFSGVTTNQGFIHIQNNPALTSIYGLHNLNAANITFLYLMQCPQLSICGVQSICNYLNSGTSNFVITGNTTGCLNKPDIQANCVYQPVVGCKNPNAHNYNPAAIYDDGSCETCSDGLLNGDETGIDCGGTLCQPCPEIPGCMNPLAYNYNPAATVDNGSCETCTDGIMNGDETGMDCGGSTCAASCIIPGCTDPAADNYNPNANQSNGSCVYCHNGILDGNETSVDCGGACGNVCPQAPFVPCNNVILYVDQHHPDHEGTTNDRDIYLKEAIFFLEGLTHDGPYVIAKVQRKSDFLKHDWTINGACIDGTPNGDKDDVDKGKAYRDCIPLVRGDIQAGVRKYKLNVSDFYGSCECTGSYWVDTLTFANYAIPEIQKATTEDNEPSLDTPAKITNRTTSDPSSNVTVVP
ncbi:MAG: hypothetical protein M3R25_00440, partial [Bacteroidota bacterium]|nr:hypothetical protein [Bacteroidota bacterium]